MTALILIPERLPTSLCACLHSRAIAGHQRLFSYLTSICGSPVEGWVGCGMQTLNAILKWYCVGGVTYGRGPTGFFAALRSVSR